MNPGFFNQASVQDENSRPLNQQISNKNIQRNGVVQKPSFQPYPQPFKQPQQQQYQHFSNNNNTRSVLQDMTNKRQNTLGSNNFVFGSTKQPESRQVVPPTKSVESFSVFSNNTVFSNSGRSQFIVKNGQFVPTNTTQVCQQLVPQVLSQRVEAPPPSVVPQDDLLGHFDTSMDEQHLCVEEEEEEEEEEDLDQEIENNNTTIKRIDLAQECIEYAQDIYNHLRNTENRYKPDPNYMRDRQTDINPGMRAILVDWLNEVCQEYKLRMETLYLAVNIADRTLSKYQIQRNKLQEVGITALFISAKYNELSPPTVDDFVYITDNTYPKSEILAMESIILNALEFNLTVVTSNDFLVKFLKSVNQMNTICSDLSFYLTELTLQDYRMIGFLPSAIAASAVIIALHTMGLDCWPESLAQVSGYSKSDLQDCISELLRVYFETRTSNLAAVKTKYSRERYNRASLVPLPHSSPLLH